MPGVRLGHRAQLDSSSGVTLWPINGQQPVNVTQKYQISSLGISKEERLKKYQLAGIRYLILVMKRKKAG